MNILSRHSIFNSLWLSCILFPIYNLCIFLIFISPCNLGSIIHVCIIIAGLLSHRQPRAQGPPECAGPTLRLCQVKLSPRGWHAMLPHGQHPKGSGLDHRNWRFCQWRAGEARGFKCESSILFCLIFSWLMIFLTAAWRSEPLRSVWTASFHRDGPAKPAVPRLQDGKLQFHLVFTCISMVLAFGPLSLKFTLSDFLTPRFYFHLCIQRR